jgi:hypothetical protein
VTLTLMPVDIQSYIKELASTKLVIGGIYDVNAAHLSISTIDVFSDQFYPPASRSSKATSVSSNL